MGNPALIPKPRFRWKRFFASLAIIFFSVEFIGTSLTLVVLMGPELVRAIGHGGLAMGPDPASFSAMVGIYGLVLTAIPAGAYSLLMAITFSRWRWTRKLRWAIAYSAALTLGAFLAGWIFILRGAGMIPGSEGSPFTWMLGGISLLSAVGGAWVLHRYFKIVERHDEA